MATPRLCSRLKTTAADARISTVDRYADSVGYIVQHHLAPVELADDQRTVVVH